MLPGWERIDIGGHEAAVFTPPAAARPFALLWLHDEAGALPDTDAALTAELRARNLRCVAPLAGPSWWVDRMTAAFDPARTPERHLLDHVVPWMLANFRLSSHSITVAVAGVGMGGQGAVRLGFRHPERFSAVASIAGAFDFHERYDRGNSLDELYPSREHARQDTAILHISGAYWPMYVWFACSPGSGWYRGNDRLHEKLAAIGVPHTADLDTVGPPEHFYPAMLDFVVAALERESRRLM